MQNQYPAYELKDFQLTRQQRVNTPKPDSKDGTTHSKKRDKVRNSIRQRRRSLQKPVFALTFYNIAL